METVARCMFRANPELEFLLTGTSQVLVQFFQQMDGNNMVLESCKRLIMSTDQYTGQLLCHIPVYQLPGL